MSSSRSHLPQDSERDEFVGHVRLVVTRLARQLRQHSEHALTPTQESMMSAITRRGPLPLSSLAAHEGVAAATVTSAVDRLVALGYVERLQDPSDRRITLVDMSRKGRAAMDAARQRRTAWLAQRMSMLDAEDWSKVADAIGVLERLIEREDP